MRTSTSPRTSWPTSPAEVEPGEARSFCSRDVEDGRMARLLIVTGPPGAGKSTVARLVVATFEPSVLVEGDAFFGFLRRGAIRPWLPAADRQNQVVTKAAAAASGRYASGGFTTVYDGVVGPWFLPTFANASGLPQLDYVILLPSVARCLEGVPVRARVHRRGRDAADAPFLQGGGDRAASRARRSTKKPGRYSRARARGVRRRCTRVRGGRRLTGRRR